MDDRTISSAFPAAAPPRPAPALGPLRRCAACLAMASAVWAAGGCSLFTMAGKMFFGDPKLPAAFRQSTKVDLADGEKTVLIIASTPESMKSKIPGVDVEIVDRVSRALRSKGVKVHPSKEVLNWYDDRGSRWGSPSEVAAAFEADYIIEIEVERFSHREDQSPDLLRGKASGSVRAYEVRRSGDGPPQALSVFARELDTTYPMHAPKPAHLVSDRIFMEEFLGRVCLQIAQNFYDHGTGETVH